MTDPTRPAYDVLGLGNAIVDVIAETDERTLERLDLAKGTMTLIDRARMTKLYAGMGPAIEMSGGSCANTMAAPRRSAPRAAYVGKVQDDQLGEVFRHDIRATGVDFRTPPLRQGPPTARCLVFVTRDAQRTMATYLGACVELKPDDVDEAQVAAAGIVYLEGYLWDRPGAKAACLKAAQIAHRHGRRVALSLSDPFCVDRWRTEFADLIARHVDILIANEDRDLQPVRHQRARAGRRWRAARCRSPRRPAAPRLGAGERARHAPHPRGAGRCRGRQHRRRRPVRRRTALWPRPRSAAAGVRAARQPAAAEVLGHFGARPKRRAPAARRRAQAADER